MFAGYHWKDQATWAPALTVVTGLKAWKIEIRKLKMWQPLTLAVIPFNGNVPLQIYETVWTEGWAIAYLF